MWWYDRRTLLTGAAAALAGCGFAPVYGPGGGAARLQDNVALPEPGDEFGYIFNRRMEARLGRGTGGAYLLDRTLRTGRAGLGGTSAGVTTRIRLDGSADFTLRDAGTGAALVTGTTTAATGYSATGSTVATLAAERDAVERLASILADQVIDELLLNAAALSE